jgi:hypothetical protein
MPGGVRHAPRHRSLEHDRRRRLVGQAGHAMDLERVADGLDIPRRPAVLAEAARGERGVGLDPGRGALVIAAADGDPADLADHRVVVREHPVHGPTAERRALGEQVARRGAAARHPDQRPAAATRVGHADLAAELERPQVRDAPPAHVELLGHAAVRPAAEPVGRAGAAELAPVDVAPGAVAAGLVGARERDAPVRHGRPVLVRPGTARVAELRAATGEPVVVQIAAAPAVERERVERGPLAAREHGHRAAERIGAEVDVERDGTRRDPGRPHLAGARVLHQAVRLDGRIPRAPDGVAAGGVDRRRLRRRGDDLVVGRRRCRQSQHRDQSRRRHP